MARILRLFTQHFPYDGGETFLIEELSQLSAAFDTVIVMPSDVTSRELQMELPGNVHIEELTFSSNNLRLRRILGKYGLRILGMYVYEFYKSKHRWKYVLEAKWNVLRLVGLINKSESIPQEWKEEDSIWYTYWFNDWTSILAWKRRLGWKNRLVTRAHGFDFDEAQRASGYHPFRHCEMQDVNQVVQISDYGKHYMLKQLGKDLPISRSYLGSKDCGEGPINADNVYTLVTCSNLVPLKRLQLMPLLLSHIGIPFQWIHFGGDDARLASLAALTQNYLDATQFEFKGLKSNSEILEYYSENAVDVFMNISEMEGLPFSMIEASSFGIPLMGCAICGVPEIVNEDTGLLIPKDFDPKEVAKQLELKLQTTFRDKLFRSGVREFWKKNFRADNNYPDFISNNLITEN